MRLAIVRLWMVQLVIISSKCVRLKRSEETTVNTTEGINDDEPLWRTYLKCQPTLGTKSVICDPNDTLRVYDVRKKVEDILWSMQADVPCYCVDYCKRYDDVPIQSGVNAAIVTFTGGDLPDDLEVIAERISTQIKYGSEDNNGSNNKPGTCDNSLLLIYAIDTRALFLYPGSEVKPVFDYLPTNRRRIEPGDLVEYLREMLDLLQRRAPNSVAVSKVSRGVWPGWEGAVGMVAAVLLAVVAFAALVSLFLSGCCCRRPKSEIEQRYADELAAYRQYEKECKEWTKRARYLAKHRVKMVRAMQKPNWNKKVEGAKRRLQETKMTAEGDQCREQQPTPCYIVSEPSSVYNCASNWSLYENGDVRRGDAADLGTIRSDRNRASAGEATLERKRRERETQRRDFYFQEE